MASLTTRTLAIDTEPNRCTQTNAIWICQMLRFRICHGGKRLEYCSRGDRSAWINLTSMQRRMLDAMLLIMYRNTDSDVYNHPGDVT